ncbi:MAG: hypothetical protein R2827_15535 [Bdellovibrionales bacterium]
MKKLILLLVVFFGWSASAYQGKRSSETNYCGLSGAGVFQIQESGSRSRMAVVDIDYQSPIQKEEVATCIRSAELVVENYLSTIESKESLLDKLFPVSENVEVSFIVTSEDGTEIHIAYSSLEIADFRARRGDADFLQTVVNFDRDDVVTMTSSRQLRDHLIRRSALTVEALERAKSGSLN